MAEIDNRTLELISTLKKHHFRLTPQRMELVKLIAASEGHPSALQFHQQITKRFPTISLATVYKTLSLLKEVGEVFEIDLRDDNHYDGCHPQPHPHLVCMRCNKIVDGNIEIDQVIIQTLEQTTGFKILQPQLTFFGLCQECGRKTNHEP